MAEFIQFEAQEDEVYSVSEAESEEIRPKPKRKVQSKPRKRTSKPLMALEKTLKTEVSESDLSQDSERSEDGMMLWHTSLAVFRAFRFYSDKGCDLTFPT